MRTLLSTYARVVSHTEFRRLLLGHGIATLGQLQLTMAVALEALNRGGGGSAVSIAVALGFAPYILFSWSAGVLADRFRRSSVIRVSIALRIATGAAATIGLHQGWGLPVLLALTAVTATAATPSYPALTAVIRQVIASRDLATANSLATGVENAGWVAGPGLFGLVLLLGAPVAGGGAAATACFAVALVAVGRCRTPRPEGPQSHGAGTALAGLEPIRSSRRVRTALAVAVVDNFMYGYLVVAIVLVAPTVFGPSDRGVGLLNTAFAAGAFASMVLTPLLATRGLGSRALIGTMFTFCVAGALLGAGPGVQGAVGVVLLCGLLTITVEIVAVTMMQQSAPEHLTARLFGIYDTLAVAAVAAGSAVAGVASQGWGPRPAVTATSLAAGGVTLLIAALATRAVVPAALPEEE